MQMQTMQGRIEREGRPESVPSQTKRPEMVRAVEDLDQVNEQLAQVLEALQRRLEPLMGYPTPCNKECGKDVASPDRFWSMIDMQTERIRGSLNCIKDIMERLEL